ncbi:hypothetical protein HO173_009842 [Letharia columbiana]|uniref:Uncharacterized protein n=1 Tax=Letharia columbiana TaxID=112416 RepID=A0A8H6L1H0_9LECA|nr:uncharacterized protein HO173_009842 [Letharia columbiana]KAF6232005.1 hypothetical protein HO173_009842 [Letharia columbiana]
MPSNLPKNALNDMRDLANYHGGRVILDAEDPGEHASGHSFWWARAEYYRLEHEKLQEDDYHRASRSVTPGVAYPGVPWYTELDRAKCEAGNVARMLADFPAGKALLEAEDHGNLTKDGDYWWSLENFQKPPPEVELQRTKLERAKRSADSRARDLATFPAGKALLDAEDHGDCVVDPGYWWNKKKYYEAEYDKLQEEFWERWKRTHLDGGETPLESLECGESPPEALNASRPKTRARKSSAPRERPSARVTRSTTQRGKETDRPLLGSTASSPNSDAGTKKTKDARSIERRQSKNKYRRQNAHVAERKPPPPSPSQACSVDQRPYNGYATPRSDESRTRRSTIKELCKGSTQQRRHKVTDKISDGEQKKKSYSQSQNPYVTPSSPDFSTVRARQRRKRKDIARQKRRLDWDSTYLESRAVSQPTSSRLRSSTGIHGKRKL